MNVCDEQDHNTCRLTSKKVKYYKWSSMIYMEFYGFNFEQYIINWICLTFISGPWFGLLFEFGDYVLDVLCNLLNGVRIRNCQGDIEGFG